MKKPETLEEIIAYLEGIPSEKWCKLHLTNGSRHCALGHLRGMFGNIPDAICNLESRFQISGSDITHANDAPGDPKENVLRFLWAQKEKVS